MLPIQKREEKSEVALLDAEHGAPRKGSTAGDPLWIGAQGKASGASAFNNLTKAFLGAASFELPWALKQSGIGFGILSLIIFAWTCAYTLKILGRMRVMVMRGNGCSVGHEGRGQTQALCGWEMLVGALAAGTEPPPKLRCLVDPV